MNVRNLKRLVIPKHTTAQIQPLDVFYNYQHKYITRRLFDRVRLDDLNVNLSERNNVIRTQALIYNQLCAPIFRKMLQYAWYASGYTKEHPGSFTTARDVCFSFYSVICSGESCESVPVICCSWCGETLCFTHFFDAFHFHHGVELME